MALSPLSNIKNVLLIPVVTGAIINRVTQTPAVKPPPVTDVAKDEQKCEELINRLATTQETESFSKVSNQSGIIDLVATRPAEPSPIPVSPDNRTADYKVTISEQPAFGPPVVFNVMPTISETRAATYDSVQPLHHPGEILKYKSSSARTWRIDVKLISRNSQEASTNLRIINRIRSWVMPFYGYGTGQDAQTKKFLGAPPPILTLTAYGDQMIGPVRCILESYDWSWPNDVDYIPTLRDDAGISTPFPAIMSLNLSMKEAWSPAEYSGFNLTQYRNGNMALAFSRVTANRPSGPAGYNSDAGAGQSSSAFAATDPRRLDISQPTSVNAGRSSKSFSDTDPRRLDISDNAADLSGNAPGYFAP